MTASTDKLTGGVFGPRNWPAWAGIGVLWLLSRLPWSWQLRIGRLLGQIMLRLARRRARIALRNIELCFPELPRAGQLDMLRANFASMGIGIMEMAMSWWAPERRLRRLARIEGLEHLQTALQQGHGAILLSAHFTTMEIGGRLLSLYTPFQVLYREHKNPVMEHITRRGREGFAQRVIPRDDLLAVRRSLRENIPVWYAPDQDFGLPKSLFAPFFNIPAATITATSRIARAARTPVVPFVQTRLPGSRGYLLKLYPALEDFPGSSVEDDTCRINRLIEDLIRAQPEQYLWAHRRFKTRPEGMEPLYD